MRSQPVSSQLGISKVLAWRLFLLVFYWRAGRQLSYVPAFLPRVCVTVLGLLQGNFKCPWVSGLLLQFMSAHLLVLVVLQCIVFEASCSSCSVLVCFFPFLLTPYYQQQYYSRYFSTELSVQCDGCLGWGRVWWAGLVVGQALGFFLPGLGVGGSSPQVPRHPTSM